MIYDFHHSKFTGERFSKIYIFMKFSIKKLNIIFTFNYNNSFFVLEICG